METQQQKHLNLTPLKVKKTNNNLNHPILSKLQLPYSRHHDTLNLPLKLVQNTINKP